MNGVERSNDGVVLRKCPFCGGEARIHSRCNHIETGNETMYFVNCNECRAESGWYYKAEKAIKAWNNRKPLERVIERLDKKLKIAEKEMEECTFKGMPFYDMQEGYAKAMYKAIEIIKELM